MSTERHEHESHILPIRTYMLVFIALMVLLVLTVGVAFVDMGPFSLVAALLIASIKGLLIMLYFMHVKYSNKLVWLFAGSGFIWLLILIGLAASDYISRYWIGQLGP
jgi:cytochrome c oxidase subunit 4